MTTFEDVVSKAKTVAETAGKKTSDFIEATKLKVQAAEIEKDIASMLEGLGRLVYDAHKAGEDVSALIEDCSSKLDERQAQLAELREKIDEFKNKVRCRRCGAANAEDAVYCKHCGGKLQD